MEEIAGASKELITAFYSTIESKTARYEVAVDVSESVMMPA